MDYTDFSKNVLIWYSLNKRDLPWRYKKNEKKDPYKIWVSEVMLQQTTVQTVIPYYEKFIKKWPNIKKLASTNINEVLDFWSGLGYYRRARNLHLTSKIVSEQFDGAKLHWLVNDVKISGLGYPPQGYTTKTQFVCHPGTYRFLGAFAQQIKADTSLIQLI